MAAGEYQDVKTWVEEQFGEKLPDDLWEWAHDGKKLCELANILKEGTVDMGMLNKRSGPMFHMQNIDFATEGFKKLLPKKYGSRIFRSPDLYEKGSSYPKQIWICLDALKSEDEKGHFEKGFVRKPKKPLKNWGPGTAPPPKPAAPASSTAAPVRTASTYGAQVKHEEKPAEKPVELPPALAKDIEKTKKKFHMEKKKATGNYAPTQPMPTGPLKETEWKNAENTSADYPEVKAWVEARLGERLSDDLHEWSHDGKRLCKLANALRPGTVDMKMLNRRNGAFFHMQNIDFATDGFKKMLPRKYQGRLFRSPDLYEKLSSYPKGIWICLDALKNLDEDGKLLNQN